MNFAAGESPKIGIILRFLGTQSLKGTFNFTLQLDTAWADERLGGYSGPITQFGCLSAIMAGLRLKSDVRALINIP
ncbi:hypothetical protein AWN88_19335 [Agrobacterium tumefaciens]|nr:hypothetical protein AWN88_19335 [Agrobacterium tumefaciens]KAJ32796.1 hypothetical protein BW45_17855 [Agrobacterium tumefaciens]